jgi:extradiol dioxygenase family protein
MVPQKLSRQGDDWKAREEDAASVYGTVHRYTMSKQLENQWQALMAGEQWTMFFKDPSGNALEFKVGSSK